MARNSLHPDPLYVDPFIDIDEWRDAPVRHRYVHGGFTDTDLRFSMYFPPAEAYEGRFLQPVMHIAGDENVAVTGELAGLGNQAIQFAFDSGNKGDGRSGSKRQCHGAGYSARTVAIALRAN